MNKFTTYAAVTTAVLTMLAACGGGGGGGSAPATPVTSSTQSYAGNWALSCDASSEVGIVTSAANVTPITTKPAYTIFSLKSVAASGSNKFAGQTESQYFDNPTCTGVAKDKQTRGFSFTIDGQAVVGDKTVDKVTVTEAAIGGLSAGSTITINGVVYPGSYFTSTIVDQDIFLVEGTKWSTGVSVPAGQYPTVLDPAVFFTKQ